MGATYLYISDRGSCPVPPATSRVDIFGGESTILADYKPILPFSWPSDKYSFISVGPPPLLPPQWLINSFRYEEFEETVVSPWSKDEELESLGRFKNASWLGKFGKGADPEEKWWFLSTRRIDESPMNNDVVVWGHSVFKFFSLLNA